MHFRETLKTSAQFIKAAERWLTAPSPEAVFLEKFEYAVKRNLDITMTLENYIALRTHFENPLQPLKNERAYGERVPDHSQSHCTHGIYAQWLVALTVLPDLLGIQAQDAFDTLSPYKQLACFNILARGTQDVSIIPHACDLKIQAKATWIADALRPQEQTTYDRDDFFTVRDDYSQFLDAYLNVKIERDGVLAVPEDRRGDLLDMMSQANTNYPHIEKTFAHLTFLSPLSENIKTHINKQAAAYLGTDDPDLRKKREKILHDIYNISLKYLGFTSKSDKFKEFISDALPYLKLYVSERCKDLNIPNVLIYTESNSDGKTLGKAFISSRPLRDDTNAITLLGYDTYKGSFFSQILKTIEHELLHVQSGVILGRLDCAHSFIYEQSTLDRFPPLPFSDPLVQMFLPLWRNTDDHDKMMVRRYYSSGSVTRHAETLFANIDLSEPENLSNAKSRMHELYRSQPEEQAARHASDAARLKIVSFKEKPVPKYFPTHANNFSYRPSSFG